MYCVTLYVVCSYLSLEAEDVLCTNDYVEVREGSNVGRLLARFCGTDLPTNITSGENLFIVFRTNGNLTGNGFMAHYTSCKCKYYIVHHSIIVTYNCCFCCFSHIITQRLIHLHGISWFDMIQLKVRFMRFFWKKQMEVKLIPGKNESQGL